MNTDHLSYYQLVERRLQMLREINGDLIDQYDGIHREKTFEQVI
jgi:hypothetical protein